MVVEDEDAADTQRPVGIKRKDALVGLVDGVVPAIAQSLLGNDRAILKASSSRK